MTIVYSIVVVMCLIGLMGFGFINLCVYLLLRFPTSKVSGWIRRHIITDEDLEPLKGSDPE